MVVVDLELANHYDISARKKSVTPTLADIYSAYFTTNKWPNLAINLETTDSNFHLVTTIFIQVPVQHAPEQ